MAKKHDNENLIFVFVMILTFIAVMASFLSWLRLSHGADFATFSINQRMINAINKYRDKHHLPPLVADPLLMRLAAERAPFYSHHAGGAWSWEAAHRLGFTGAVSDNLCQGAQSPEEAVLDGWGGEDNEKNPAGHNYQMQGLMSVNGRWVDQHFNVVGVAVSGRNYIAIFGFKEPDPPHKPMLILNHDKV